MLRTILLPGACALALAGCDLAPRYQVPLTTVPVAYKEAALWHPAQPADTLPRGAWWTIFGDKQLDGLEAKVDAGNPTLAAALASYERARGFVGEAKSGLFPTFSVGGYASHDRQSDLRPLRGKGQPDEYLDNVIDVQARYEVDLWDRVANTVKASRQAAQASAADLEAVRLSRHAELAGDYINLRGLDAQAEVLTAAVTAYRQAVSLTQTLFAGKLVSAIDVSRAEAQLATAESQRTETNSRRALLEHAIAVLIGLTPAELTLAPAPWALHQVEVPTGLPSTLLERRPDVASAERQVAAANATIGVTRAAFYPTLSLNLIYGLESTQNALFRLPNDFWAIGPGLVMPLFEGGLRHAEESVAVSNDRLATAQYRAAVLAAFADVEDDLSRLRLYADEAAADQRAADAAQRTVDMSTNLYRDGAVSYLDVVVAQTAALAARQAVIDIRTRRMAVAVSLVRDLGGGWTRADLPSFEAIDAPLPEADTLPAKTKM
jgi:NodT family efflux transporter outer membrane factor (OMF) lipoprotein